MKIAIYGRNFTPDFNESILLLFSKLKDQNMQIFVYKPFYDFISRVFPIETFKISGLFSFHSDFSYDTDFVLSIGGDGTYLEAVTYIRNKNIPIVGLNSGRLGFLANISSLNLISAIDDLINNRFYIEKRSLIQLESEVDIFGDFKNALNEFTIHKKDSSSMIKIQAFVNNEYLNTYWADGLIVSTPTGSTAYSMSAGGPIVTPDSNNFIISPLAPHNLTVRPLILPDSCELKFRVDGRNTNYLLTLDYRNEVLDKTIDIIIKKADFQINSIGFKQIDFFSTLRNKLMWGIDSRN